MATNPPEDHSGLTGLWVSDAQTTEPGVLWAGLDRAELRRKHAAGELQELEFDACVFRAVYPNWNYVRFRPEDLDAFAASFVGAPFLRNHNMQDIAARDGIVTGCCMNGDGMYARIKLTTEEGIRDFLAGRIDRFSISWFKRGPTICSVCGCDWLGAECEHVPGRAYAVGRDGGARAAVCELVQVDPVGREVSAVNVPASGGTGLMSEQLEQWIAFKERNRMSGATNEEIVQVEEHTAATGGADALAAEFADLRDEVLAEVAGIREERDRLQLDATLAASGLPDASQAVIRRVAEPLLGCLDFDQVRELIGLQKSALAAAVQPTLVTGMRPLTDHWARPAHGRRRPAGGARLVSGRAGRTGAAAVAAQHPRRLPGHHGRRRLLRRLQPGACAAGGGLDDHAAGTGQECVEQGDPPAL